MKRPRGDGAGRRGDGRGAPPPPSRGFPGWIGGKGVEGVEVEWGLRGWEGVEVVEVEWVLRGLEVEWVLSELGWVVLEVEWAGVALALSRLRQAVLA